MVLFKDFNLKGFDKFENHRSETPPKQQIIKHKLLTKFLD